MSGRSPLVPVALVVAFALASVLAIGSGSVGQQQIDLGGWKLPGERVPEEVQSDDSSWRASELLVGTSPEFLAAREKAALRALEIRTRFDELHLA